LFYYSPPSFTTRIDPADLPLNRVYHKPEKNPSVAKASPLLSSTISQGLGGKSKEVTSNHLGLPSSPTKAERDLSMNSQPMMTGMGKYFRLDMLGSSMVLKFLGFHVG